MPQVTYIDTPDIPAKYSLENSWVDSSKFTCRGRRFTHKNVEYEIIHKKEDVSDFLPGRIFLAAFAIFASLGIVLCFRAFHKWAFNGEKVRFAIPTQKIEEFLQKPEAGQVATKIEDFKKFYYIHFQATNNQNAINTVLDNCLESSKTIQELLCVTNFMMSKKIKPLTESITNKLQQVDCNEVSSPRPLIQLINYFKIKDEVILSRVAQKFLEVAIPNLKRGEILPLESALLNIDFESELYSADIISSLIRSTDALSTKAATAILIRRDASANALLLASAYALTKPLTFSEEQLIKAAKTCLNAPALPSHTLIKCLTYIACRKANFTAEEKTAAMLRYQSLNDHKALAALMATLF